MCEVGNLIKQHGYSKNRERECQNEKIDESKNKLQKICGWDPVFVFRSTGMSLCRWSVNGGFYNESEQWRALSWEFFFPETKIWTGRIPYVLLHCLMAVFVVCMDRINCIFLLWTLKRNNQRGNSSVGWTAADHAGHAGCGRKDRILRVAPGKVLKERYKKENRDDTRIMRCVCGCMVLFVCLKIWNRSGSWTVTYFLRTHGFFDLHFETE